MNPCRISGQLLSPGVRLSVGYLFVRTFDCVFAYAFHMCCVLCLFVSVRVCVFIRLSVCLFVCVFVCVLFVCLLACFLVHVRKSKETCFYFRLV